MIAFALALQLLATAPATSAPAMPVAPAGRPFQKSAPSAPGLPNFVQLVSLDGLPADSLVRERFMSGFRGEFSEADLPAEKLASSGEWEASARFSNRFKWLEGDASDDTWKLQVTLGSPPAVVLPQRGSEHGHRAMESHRRSRGMIAAFTLQPPVVAGDAPPRVQERYAFAFPRAATPGDTSATLSVPGVGYLFPWNDAGRAVARLALEMLHRSLGDMEKDERFSIEPAVRAEAGR